MTGSTTLQMEIMNAYGHCVWILKNNDELALSYSEQPRLQAAAIPYIFIALQPTANHLSSAPPQFRQPETHGFSRLWAST